MSDDTCKREVYVIDRRAIARNFTAGYKVKTICNKPKPVDKLYCPDCEKEVLGEKDDHNL